MAFRPAASSSAQAPPNAETNRPAFDAVSIKSNKSGELNARMQLAPGGVVHATGVTLQMLINFAYQLKPQQLIGAPGWADSEHFDVEAKPESRATADQVRIMLQSLLADRFKLAAHTEKRQIPIYSLVLVRPGKLGPRLLAHTDDSKCPDTSTGPPQALSRGGTPVVPCGAFAMMNGKFVAPKISMEMLARTLSNSVDRVVVDRTGLSGTFDVDLEFARPAKQSGLKRKCARPFKSFINFHCPPGPIGAQIGSADGVCRCSGYRSCRTAVRKLMMARDRFFSASGLAGLDVT